MRNAFASEITQIGLENEKLVLLAGDIGNKLFDKFKEACPDRFYNCGVAEANMTGMAAGLAMSGLRPVTYTITPFNTTRCLEQIRVDVCYQNVPVVIVGVGGGLSYASLGGTHHSCEDIAFLRMLPNMSVICPADATEVRLALRAAIEHDGPSYIRLGKKGEPVIHATPPHFKIGRGIVVRKGDDVALLSTGNMMPTTLGAAEELAKRGVSAHVVSFHTVKPLDKELLSDVFSRFKLVATIEEHSILGGLGGSVAEWLSEQAKVKARFVRFGTADSFLHEAGEQDHFRKHFGLTAEAIAGKALSHLQNGHSN